MSWLFSQALVEEYSEANFSDGEPSVPLNGSHTQLAYCAPDKMTVFSRLSRFGMTFKPLTDIPGEDLLMSSVVAFHARTLVRQERGQELTENDPECGEKWRGSFTKYDLDSRSWKTHQCSLLGGLEPYLETWPRWGLMRDGECWEQQTLEQSIKGIEFGLSQKIWPTPTASMMPCEGTIRIMRKAWLNGEISLEEASTVAGKDIRKAQGKIKAWPTPQASDSRNRGNMSNPSVQRRVAIGKQIMLSQSVDPTSGALNPAWVEWLMGWPLGWTDLKPLVTDKFHYARQQHGEF